MQYKTKLMKEAMARDLAILHRQNNSQDARRTPEQIRQSRQDRANYVINKWRQEKPETVTQRRYVETVIEAAKHEAERR